GLAEMRWPEPHRVDAQLVEVVARPLAAADGRMLRHAVAAEPPAEVEAPYHRQEPTAHVGDHDLETGKAVEQAPQDHTRERHRGVERSSHQFIELELVHLPIVADRHARRMDEERNLAVARPFPERIGVFAVDESAMPARRDQQPLEPECKAALAL